MYIEGHGGTGSHYQRPEQKDRNRVSKVLLEFMGGNISCVKYPLCQVSTICGCLNVFIYTHNDFKNTIFFQI